MMDPRPLRRVLLASAGAVLLAGSPAGAAPVGDPDAAPDPVEALSPHVVGGQPVPTGKWPDTAAVMFGGEQGCTGVLVAPDVVLTAAHCIDGSLNEVLLGVNDLRHQGERIRVMRRVPYPDWSRSYDIGVLVLERASNVTPRALAVDCIEPYVQNSAPVAIVGYGAVNSSGTQYDDRMMEAETIITDLGCLASGRGCVNAIRPDGELGAGGMGIDSCLGDSGGPLYLLTDRGPFLVGLTSRGYTGSTTTCSEGGIYVRPAAVLDWIEQESGRAVTRPTCNLAPAPTADPIEVKTGGRAVTIVLPNDPDPGDSHTYAITVAPEHGSATIAADGTAVYVASADHEGPDSFTVVVTDDGDPSLSGEVVVAVTVLADGCGCRSGTGGGGSALLVVLVALALAPRRRRATFGARI
jgi:MYXO-CTERM domain-containing protein